MQQDYLEVGKTFSKLKLTGNNYFDKEKRRRFVEVYCECGVIKWVRFDSLKSGRTTSCGCIVIERLRFSKKPAVTHGLSSHPLYTVFRRMIERCYDKRHKSYMNYGGKGVIVCEEWKNDFLIFFDWAKDKWEDKLQLDKDILYCNIHGGKSGKMYCPEYCMFVTSKENSNAKSTSRIIEYLGIKRTMKQWTEYLNFGRTVLSNRIDRYGWTIEKAITTPLK